MKIFLFLAILFSIEKSFASETIMLSLNRSDSVEFAQAVDGFNDPKKSFDPEHPEISIVKKWYQSKDRGATIACKTSLDKNEAQIFTTCDLNFSNDGADREVKIEKKTNGVVRVTISDSGLVKKMYKNLNNSSFYSLESVSIGEVGHQTEVPRLFVECVPAEVAGESLQNCALEFVPN
jgi:hypothetical protein